MTTNRQDTVEHIEMTTFPSGHRNLTDAELDDLLAHYVRQTGGGWKTRAAVAELKARRARAAAATDSLRVREVVSEAIKQEPWLSHADGGIAGIHITAIATRAAKELAGEVGLSAEGRRIAGEISPDARRRVLYFAAPLRPTLAEMSKCGVFDFSTEPGSRAAADLERAIRKCAERANLNRAKEGLTTLRRAFPETSFIAPWISSVLSGDDDSDPAQRDAGLIDACAVVERCDGIVLWGSRLSDGMRLEMEHGVRSRDLFEVYNLVGGRWQSALAGTRGMAFADWYRCEIAGGNAGL